jgi:DNA-binding MarR family transcriptional regulator
MQHLTTKQIALLAVIAKGNGPDQPMDLDEILDAITYETTKQSLQFSIRALIARGLIYKKGVEKRRGRQRQVIAATTAGKVIAFAGTPAAASVPGASVASAILETDLDLDSELLG